jgi:hypothetical protein
MTFMKDINKLDARLLREYTIIEQLYKRFTHANSGILNALITIVWRTHR